MKKIGSIMLVLFVAIIKSINAQPVITVAPTAYQTQTYFCAAHQITASVQAGSNPSQPTTPTCCNSNGPGTYTFKEYDYHWFLNGTPCGADPTTSPSDSVSITVPNSGNNTITCTIDYEWQCSDGTTIGYTSPSDTATPYTFAAFVDDSGNAPPPITAPNNPPPIAEPNQSITSILVGSGANAIQTYDLYLQGGSFTGIQDTDTYGNPYNNGHTDCGQVGATISWSNASTSLSVGFGSSISSFSYSGSVGVNLPSTGSASAPIGADHQRIFYEVCDRSSSITAATNTGSHLWVDYANGTTRDLGPATPSYYLPSPAVITGHVLATSLPQACCPDTVND